MATVLERFMAKIDDSAGPRGCWPWTASTTPHGYGHFMVSATYRTYAHRWFLGHLRGRPLGHGELAIHSCDNPPCVNPAHLRVGTQIDNMQDCVARGRHRNPIADELRQRTHCVHGHEFTEANTYRYPSGRKRGCRICRAASWKSTSR